MNNKGVLQMEKYSRINNKLSEINDIIIVVDTYELFKHCMKDNYFSAHLMVRMLAIDCYYKKNNFGWDWYNTMQKKRVALNPIVPKYMADHSEEFKDLIDNIEKKGYDYEKPITLNGNLNIIDGAHRLATALYFGIKEVSIIIPKDHYDDFARDYSLQWFLDNGLGYMEKEIKNKYREVCLKYEN